MENYRSLPGFEEFEKEFNSKDLNRENEIGSSEYRFVFAIKSKKDGQIYAVKNILNTDAEDDDENGILDLLERNIQHKNIVQINGIFKQKNKKGVTPDSYIVMQKGERSLSREIIIRRKLNKFYSEEEQYELFSGITEGLIFLH